LAAFISQLGDTKNSLLQINFCKKIPAFTKIAFYSQNIANKQSDKINQMFVKNAFPQIYQLNDLVWYEDFTALGKNAKLIPN
jgi:hypothetical protein